MIVVLINDTVKKYLLKLPAANRKRIRDKFEYLETGIWDTGLKVKKLKALSSKYIFEARLDRGNRILFTLGHPGQDKQTLIIYVWGISEHDDVSRKSKTIIPGNAPFLQFSDYEETLMENIELEQLDHNYYTQEFITQKVDDESGSQKWYSLDEPEWKRIQMYQRDDLELFLYLTPEQKEILQTSLPLMISGTSGSGKTTLSVYYLLNERLNKKKKLFITYNTLLKKYAQKLYNGLLEQREWKDQTITPEFYTFKELCLEITGPDRFLPSREVDFNRFKQMLSTYPSRGSLDPALLWEEIRGIIKGGVPRFNLPVLEKAGRELKKGAISKSLLKSLQEQFIFFSKLNTLEAPHKFVQKYLHTGLEDFAAHIESFIYNPELQERIPVMLDKTVQALEKIEGIERTYLSFPEYEALGKKKAPNFAFNRKDIYRIFEWYREKLNTENLWDEPDLVPRTVPGKYSYDVLVCDEVQDFTDTQLNLLFNLVKNPNDIFLAGDTKQTINPSGFRWEEVRKHFYERGLNVPGLKNLSLNFRSSGSIVQLSNTLLQLKEKFLGKKAEESMEEWRYKGQPAAAVSGIDMEEMLDILRVTSVRRTILVRSEEEKEALKKRLGTELVFTINEAKGLEFETVVLWKFCADPFSQDTWKITLDLSARRINQSHIRHEINLLYVGITRSQRHLLIYDGPLPSVIWQNDPIRQHVYITGDRDFIRDIWQVPASPEEWDRQGHYFFEREFYKAAAECFKNAGNSTAHTRTLAYHRRQTGDFHQAARYFQQLGDENNAAECYEKAGEYKKALVLWERLNRAARASKIRGQVLEEEGDFNGAGRFYLEKGKYRQAVECFKRSKNYKEVADIYLRHLQDDKNAAEYYELAKDLDKAAELYSRLNNDDKAADLYYRDKNYTRAEALWKKKHYTKQLMALYKETGRHEDYLSICREQDNVEEAVKYLGKQKKDKTTLRREAEELFQKQEFFKALIRYYLLHQSDKISTCYLKMGKYREAAPYLEETGDFTAAADAYYKGEEYVEAFKLYIANEDLESDFPMARKALEKIDDKEVLGSTGKKYFQEKDWDRAVFILSRAGVFPEYEGLCYAFLGDKKKAHEIWMKEAFSMYAFHIIAHECIEHQVPEIAAEFYLTFPSRGIYFRDFLLEIKSMPWAVLENYFAKHPDGKEHQGKWGRFLMAGDRKYKNVRQVMDNLSRGGEYCYIAAYIKNMKSAAPHSYRQAINHYKKSAANFEKDGDYEWAAFMYLMTDQLDRVDRLLPKLALARNNFCFFLEGSADEARRFETYRWILDNDLAIELREYLFLMKDNEKMEEFYRYEARVKGEELEEDNGEESEWDWDLEMTRLYIDKSHKYKDDGDYSFFYPEDLKRMEKYIDS